MAYVNIPPNLQDMFYSLGDRVAKLESGPSGPQDTADAAQATAVTAQAIALSSQSVATDAQVQAINAGIQANNAASQATIAQSQATIASTQAVAAQTSANGKNKILYGTSSTPPAGTYIAGDIYYQYDGSNHIKGNQQYNGSSWQNTPFTQGTFTSLDAGAITTGTLSAIEINAGTGGTAFHVSPSGYMSAQGVYVKGNITADSGTFNGTINAQTGYFGGYGTTGNYWSIGSNGLTGVGSATITAGLIQGSSIAVPNSVSYNFAVDSSGNMTSTAGTIGGFSIQANYLTYGGQTWLNAGGGTGAGSYCLYDASRGIYLGGTMKAAAIDLGSYGWTASGTITAGTVNSSNVVTGTITGPATISGNTTVSGQFEVTGNLQIDTMAVVGSPTSTNYNTVLISKTSSGATLGRLYGYNNLSSAIYKENITDFATRDYLGIINKMRPVTFNYKADQVVDPESVIMGMIAEDIDAIEGAQDLVEYAENKPSAIRYEKIPLFIIKAIQEISNRLDKLEGK